MEKYKKKTEGHRSQNLGTQNKKPSKKDREEWILKSFCLFLFHFCVIVWILKSLDAKLISSPLSFDFRKALKLSFRLMSKAVIFGTIFQQPGLNGLGEQ